MFEKLGISMELPIDAISGVVVNRTTGDARARERQFDLLSDPKLQSGVFNELL